jgi:transcriptional regulator with XRE-family HTH domain
MARRDCSLIKKHRVSQGWTQEELGHRSGYDPVYINMLERGRRNPSVRALVDLCQVLTVHFQVPGTDDCAGRERLRRLRVEAEHQCG